MLWNYKFKAWRCAVKKEKPKLSDSNDESEIMTVSHES